MICCVSSFQVPYPVPGPLGILQVRELVHRIPGEHSSLATPCQSLSAVRKTCWPWRFFAEKHTLECLLMIASMVTLCRLEKGQNIRCSDINHVHPHSTIRRTVLCGTRDAGGSCVLEVREKLPAHGYIHKTKCPSVHKHEDGDVPVVLCSITETTFSLLVSTKRCCEPNLASKVAESWDMRDKRASIWLNRRLTWRRRFEEGGKAIGHQADDKHAPKVQE